MAKKTAKLSLRLNPERRRALEAIATTSLTKVVEQALDAYIAVHTSEARLTSVGTVEEAKMENHHKAIAPIAG